MSVIDEKVRRNMPATAMLIARVAQMRGVTVDEVREQVLEEFSKQIRDGASVGALSQRVGDALLAGVTKEDFALERAGEIVDRLIADGDLIRIGDGRVRLAE